MYLGVYDLESTYETLHAAFGDDKDAYDERPAGRSACAGVLVDGAGRLVPKSAVLSSALWAVGRIQTYGVRNKAWSDGFQDATKALLDAVDESEGRRHEIGGGDSPLALDGGALAGLARMAQGIAGVSADSRLATDRITIQSVAVSAHRGDDVVDIDFLNSFFLDDLATVRQNVASDRGCGRALATYLTGDHQLDVLNRVDVMRADDATDSAVAADRLPKGRWPSHPAHGLALRQQFAVNHALNDLAPTHGLMGVNGPPGTGKTTMLREILAANVVERARQLAALDHPSHAFTSTIHRWTSGEHFRSVQQLRPELTGYEMVVASVNNAAVENVSTEIPGRDAIDRKWREHANYFCDIATAVLAETHAQEADAGPTEAWGLIAARLGNARNRNAFYSAFWFDKKDPRTEVPGPSSPPRMQTRLAQWRDGGAERKDWELARKQFAAAEQGVDALLATRWQMQERSKQLPRSVEVEREWVEYVVRLQSDLYVNQEQLEADRIALEQTRRASALAATARNRHVDAKPGLIEALFSFGRAVREWRAALRPLDDRLRDDEATQQEAETRARLSESREAELKRELVDAQKAREGSAQFVADLRLQVEADRRRLRLTYPDAAWVGETRELHAPWLDEELDTARSNLFLAALQLHEDFLANTASTMIHGLRAALEIVAGGGPRELEPEKRRAAWQLFFLVVPLVSTTFASLGRMFGDIGSESLGWVFVDEAGQACPQYAAGAVWRAQRVVAVGDPLQLQPVVTIPTKARRAIASAHEISQTWVPPHASVQTLADRVSRHGTTLEQATQQVWVSAPLTVHRRCDEPMFSLCNTIAYNGIMVNGVKHRAHDPEKPDLFDGAAGPLIAPSHWADEPAQTPGSHLQENQFARLENGLAYLRRHGLTPSDVIAISPFRTVAVRLDSLSHRYPGLRAGTIHTAQGREAPVVFLVLGGDPASPGAKAWAASTVNLVNVAASRAQRRLYVIGDRAAWAEHNYFSQLAAFLAP